MWISYTLSEHWIRDTVVAPVILLLDFILKPTLGTGSRKRFCTFSLKIGALKPRKGRMYIVPSGVSVIHKWLPRHAVSCY